ncbi:MAG: cob(I)yrinic acid a,c-diamide adenosyltransferase [Bacteroidota bacterium]|nr:cob(I)yrinic acid a,c-diamide adenosyltransferase [Bacteroidota bacterium]MDP4215337.1 cob(I)yrinic acid a,c-diamide adenosyltransferase [Bacteroidota bacterium]MDP4244479.1 cob(I)yrinic acid a,c-diamide adenosyltransferase [Bacteroidota bacterium]MDP4255602.1 cob(I)yrinic acid a,c-diamide adenosyltransferase [Bacteroidota bacterium]MDP4258766.1 cob(I)yrinic acid a,c-diamide adenosyltransferase [Bacteroidota bacterium]
MASKIYTRTGDKGTTALIGGTKVPKNNIRIESYGTVDELNSFIGLLNDELADLPAGHPDRAALFSGAVQQLQEVQDRLFTIGSSLACDPDKSPQLKLPDLHAGDVDRLEKEIDRMSAELPPMKSFLLPGGHRTVSTAHIVRCVCRRAERLCVSMQEQGLFIEPLVLRYLNRLSDYLFMLARYIGHVLGVPGIPWKPRV